MKIILNESQLKNIITLIKEQENGEYYEISAEDYMFLMKAASYNSKVTEMKKFKGKPLYVIGNVNLSGTPTKDLGNVAIITGSLDISNSNIADISKTEVRGNVRDYGSAREKIRIRKEELAKLAEADERRQDGEWDLDNPNIDEEGLAANALFQNLVNDNVLNEMDDETKNELELKKQKLSELQERYEDVDGILEPDEISPLFDEISDLETEIEELQEGVADVYHIIPPSRSYRGIYYFEVIGLRDREYLVGQWDDVYDAAIENQEQLLDDVGIDGISQYLIEDNIDKSGIRDYMEEFYRDDITQNPEVYFDEDDYELTEEQEERKEQLENYINEMEDLKTEKEEELESTEDEDVRADLEREIEEIEDNIENAQDELDRIEPDTEPTDDMIDEKVNYYIRNTDEIGWLKEMGYDLNNWVNLKGVAQDIVDSDGIGVLNSYDGSYDEETIQTADGKKHTFVVMRMY